MRLALTLTQKVKAFPILKEAFLLIGCSLIIALFGFFKIPLPFSPVPISLQPHICLLFGAILGARRGAIAVALFLAEGALGFPVFAGYNGGLAHLLGPTGGYLIGFMIAAYIAGFLVSRGTNRSKGSIFLKIFASSFVIYLFGFLHLSNFIGPAKALLVGVLPFLPGDIIKSLGVTHFYRRFITR